MMNKLPIIYGVVVDIRLKQFRRIKVHRIDFIEFDSPRGDRLLERMIRRDKLTIDQESAIIS